MGKTITNGLPAVSAAAATLTGQQLAEGRKIMEDSFVALLGIDERENIYWTGSLTDLVEIARVAYEGGAMRDSRGCPLPFAALVRAVCAKLHICPPYNPYNAAARARQRKGVRSSTMLERFCWQKFVGGNDNPIFSELRKMG